MRQEPIRVVAFGDSLTVGYQSPTSENPEGRPTPYADFLKQRLGDRIEITMKGISGELTGEMVLRLQQDVIKHRPDCVVILGGTNDLGWGASPEEVMRNLVTLYERCRAAGIIPILVTVPSILGFEHLIPPRRLLNRMIEEYAQRHRLPFIDLFNATSDPATGELLERYSNDGLHLTTEGYQKMAELLEPVLQKMTTSPT
jgi:lysophospholipase L1-like esterase